MLASTPLILTQLTKEEEAAAGGEDMEVRREDQEKINKFSSLHQKETNLEEELRAKIVSAAMPCFALPTAFRDMSTIVLSSIAPVHYQGLNVAFTARLIRASIVSLEAENRVLTPRRKRRRTSRRSRQNLSS